MNAITENRYSAFLSGYARTLPDPDAIAVISAHWQTEGSFITGNEHPQQIYDFYGFPEELYKVKYSPPGSMEIAELVASEVGEIKIDSTRGIDHAAWAVVKHMYPEQNIPLLEISLDISKSPEQHFELGKQLKKLCTSGILFIGSGNMVHNLRDISFDDDEKPFTWAVKADEWLKEKLSNKEIEELVDYEKNFPEYKRSIPTNEHYLPLLYILGMHAPSGNIRTIYDEIQNGSISMRSIEVF